VPTALELGGDLRAVAGDTCATAWFVCSEALANVVRHAHASRASIAVRAEAETLLVEVVDDGRGGATPARGLRGLADRVEATGGTLVIISPSGGPTTVRAVMPLREH